MSSSIEVIRSRYSCRSYLNQPIEAARRQALSELIASIGPGPFGSRTRFSLVASAENDRKSLKGLGTYGMIKGAPGFIVGAVEPGPMDLEDYGHCLERAVLAATGLGLQTCWLGGSFTKSSFARRIEATRNERVPAVVAVGHAAERSRSGRMRKLAGSDNRLPHEQLFFEGRLGQPLDPSRAGEYADALEAVRWAPSASNKQPWRLVRSGETWHFYLQRTKGYGRGTATFSLLRLADLQRVDMGIAMSHFDLVTRENGLSGRWVADEPPYDEAVGNLEYTASWKEQT
jgi:nitroreductase